jgi:hypothetical protein
LSAHKGGNSVLFIVLNPENNVCPGGEGNWLQMSNFSLLKKEKRTKRSLSPYIFGVIAKTTLLPGSIRSNVVTGFT